MSSAIPFVTHLVGALRTCGELLSCPTVAHLVAGSELVVLYSGTRSFIPVCDLAIPYPDLREAGTPYYFPRTQQNVALQQYKLYCCSATYCCVLTVLL